jgi:integrase
VKGTITKYRKKDGRVSWGYYFRDGADQITKSGFGTKDEARNALDAAIANVKGAAPAPSMPVALAIDPPVEGSVTEGSKGDTRTVGAYLDYWLDNHAALRCEPTTMEDYRKLAKYLVQHLSEVRLPDLKTARIQEMVNQLRLHGGIRTKAHPQGRPLSIKRTRAVASLLHTCLGDAVRLEHLPVNPMADRRVKLPKLPKRKPPVLDPGALGRVFEIAKGKRIYSFIVVDAASGCRRGELCALAWDDVDFSKGILTISKSLEQTRKGGLRVKSTKSGETRYIGLDEFALEVLAEHREQQQQDKANFGSDYQDRGLVFCQPNGNFYSPDKVGARVKEVLVEAGCGNFSLHSLRHSHASVLLSQGVPVPVVSERLGHADQNITLGIYSHALPADVRAASKAWRNALADTISEERSRKTRKMLGNARKFPVNY